MLVLRFRKALTTPIRQRISENRGQTAILRRRPGVFFVYLKQRRDINQANLTEEFFYDALGRNETRFQEDKATIERILKAD